MAISSYSELVAAINDYSLRNDAPIDTLIALFESAIAPQLIHYRAETSTNINISQATKTISLPSDFQQMRAVFVDGKKAQPVSIFEDKIYPPDVTYYVSGNQIIFDSVQDIAKANLTYYARCPGITPTETTNWLLTYFPGVYLYGVLSHLYHWSRDEEAAAATQQQLSQALALMVADHKQHEKITNPVPQETTSW